MPKVVIKIIDKIKGDHVYDSGDDNDNNDDNTYHNNGIYVDCDDNINMMKVDV